jgi:Protein of unknown function (DUF2795)
MSQFTCEVCGDGFEQKSRFERHMATSHPEKAASAADIEKALSGIKYPKTRNELVGHASQRNTDSEIMELINSLPERTYRDSADVAVALGELKRWHVMTAQDVSRTEAPSTRGGMAAATTSVSAAAVAKMLSGVDFPKNKDELRDYAQKHITDSEVADPQRIISVIDRLPEREYKNMADVEKSVGQVL